MKAAFAIILVVILVTVSFINISAPKWAPAWVTPFADKTESTAPAAPVIDQPVSEWDQLFAYNGGDRVDIEQEISKAVWSILYDRNQSMAVIQSMTRNNIETSRWSYGSGRSPYSEAFDLQNHSVNEIMCALQEKLERGVALKRQQFPNAPAEYEDNLRALMLMQFTRSLDVLFEEQ